MPPKSEGLYSRASHSMRPSRVHSRTRAVAFGATTRTEAAVASRLSILASPTDPAPTTRARRPSSFTNIGNKLIVIPSATGISNLKFQMLNFISPVLDSGFSISNFRSEFGIPDFHPPTAILHPLFLLRRVQAALFFRESRPAPRARVLSRLHL